MATVMATVFLSAEVAMAALMEDAVAVAQAATVTVMAAVAELFCSSTSFWSRGPMRTDGAAMLRLILKQQKLPEQLRGSFLRYRDSLP